MKGVLFPYILALVIVLSSACQPLYRAGIPYQPSLKHKGELDVNVGVETGTGHVNIAYAATQHLVITGSGNAWANRSTTAQFGEGGIGYYDYNEERGFGWNALVTSGFGSSQVFVTDVGNWQEVQTTIEYESQFARIALQPGVFVSTENFDLLACSRLSGLYWLAPQEYNEQDVSGIDLYWEPAISLRFGIEAVKFFTDLSLQVPVARAFRHPFTPIHLGIGMNFNLSRTSLGLDPKEKPNQP